MQKEKLQDILSKIPDSSGVYIYKNDADDIIYVGKAASLKSRVKQYFSASGDGRSTVEKMVPQIQTIDFIVTSTVQEALLLECTLIKKYLPRYNILLKDNKTYPYICVAKSQAYPRVYTTRSLNGRDAFYGPYVSAKDVRRALTVLRRTFPFRTCTKVIETEKKAQRPCLFYNLGECPGPCAYNISDEKYTKNIDDLENFLKGKSSAIMNRLKNEMDSAAQRLDFEKAAQMRDSITSLNALQEKQYVSKIDNVNRDVIACACSVSNAYVVLFSMRNGRLFNAVDFVLKKNQDDTLPEIFYSFIMQYYSACSDIPGEIAVEVMPEYAESIQAWLSEKRRCAVTVLSPQRGEKKQLVLMAKKNAIEKLNSQTDKRSTALEQAKEAFNLKKLPLRIEGFDISTLQGTNTVSSMVVFEDGKPKKSDYRHFKIKTVIGTTDDFKSMNETLTRRLSHIAEEDYKFGKKPDLILIDGGKGQLHSAYAAMCAMGITDIDMISLAKREEEVYTLYSAEPIVLSKDNEALKLLQRVRDESHRFAITFHTLLRDKSSLISVLEDIPGIGPKKRKLLMTHFRTVGDIKNASIGEIAEVDGISRKNAEDIKEFMDW